MTTLYSYTQVDEFAQRLCERGWEYVQLLEGCLGSGDFVLIAPDDKHYNFVIREVYLNEWSSAQTIRRAAKISKRLQKEIDDAEKRQEEEEE